LGGGKPVWGDFEKEFGPTKSQVSVLVNVINGSVPQFQRDLYREIEEWYPRGVQEIFEAIRREMKKDATAFKDLLSLSLEQFPNRFQLIIINIRVPFSRPAKCVLKYRADLNESDWYVVIAEDHHVEWCGLGD